MQTAVMIPYISSSVSAFLGSGFYEQLTIFNKADEYADSLTRKVTRHLLEGNHSIKTAVDTELELTIPVSTNFCDALHGLLVLQYNR